MNVSKKLALRVLTATIAVASGIVMLACGGDPAPGPAPTTPTTGTVQLAALEVTVTSPTLQTKSDQSTALTVTAVDANRRALADIPVVLSATSGIVTTQSDKTDSQGRMSATFSLGSDFGNRTVTISAKSGAVVGAAGISVTGTTLTLTASPPNVTDPTTVVELVASVINAGKVPIGGAVVNFSTTGGTLSSAVAIADATGTAKVTLSGVTAGVTVTASSANTTASVDVKGGSTTLPTPEPAGVTIKDLTIQANPSVVGPNAGSSEANFALLDIHVTGDLGAAVGIPVGNAPVRLRIANTPAFGRLSVDTTSSPALSNSAGLVSIRFIPGAAVTGADQVVICASIDGIATLPNGGGACNANEKAVKLTISQQPLFISISTNGLIATAVTGQSYQKDFVVYVTDAVGKPISGAQVSARLLPLFYYKGSMAYDNVTDPKQWKFVTHTKCDNEDKNFNGIVDSGDVDLNMDGLLWPGQRATFSFDNGGVTDSAGNVILHVIHGQRYSLWAEYQLEARSATAGSESFSSINYLLGALQKDVETATAPGFALSPFGNAAVCSNPN